MDATSLKVKFHFFSHHTFMKSPFDLFIKQLVLKHDVLIFMSAECVTPLGLTSKKLPNSAITASSEVSIAYTIPLPCKKSS